MIMYPTHQCFDDAIEFLTARIQRRDLPDTTTLRLVHGMCLAQNGTEYAHAWVEEQGRCVDCGIVDGERVFFQLATPAYYEMRSVQRTRCYTIDEAWAWNLRSGHHGPWEKPYIDHLAHGDHRYLGSATIGRCQVNVPGGAPESSNSLAQSSALKHTSDPDPDDPN